MDSKPEAADKKADDAEKKNWAEMSDDDAENENATANEESQSKPEPEPKKIIPPTQKGTKNKQGDYIVEKFEIPDFREGLKQDKDGSDDDEEEEESSDDYGNEDENDKKTEQVPEKKEGKITHFIKTIFQSSLHLSAILSVLVYNLLQLIVIFIFIQKWYKRRKNQRSKRSKRKMPSQMLYWVIWELTLKLKSNRKRILNKRKSKNNQLMANYQRIS